MMLLNVFYWLGLLGAAAAVVIYFTQIVRFRKWVRLVTGAGLFFTGLGLAEASVAMHVSSNSELAMPNAVCVAALLAAVYFQSVAALRQRQARATDPVAAAQPSEAV